MSWTDLVTGVVAGVVATILWTLLTWVQRRRRLKRDFEPLAGTYRSTRKLRDEDEPGTLAITVRRNILDVRFAGLSDADAVIGQIAMNEHLPNSGRGHYWHAKNERQLWGFWDVQVKDSNTILVHTTYASHKEPVAVVSGFIWTRVNNRA